MSLNSLQWGFLAKLLYKFFRPELKKIIADSSNTVDDTILKVADKLVGK
jgi:hypothetical protein